MTLNEARSISSLASSNVRTVPVSPENCVGARPSTAGARSPRNPRWRTRIAPSPSLTRATERRMRSTQP